MSEFAVTPSERASGALPRGLFFAAAGLIVFALIASTFARLNDIGTLHMPARTAVEALSLRFEDQSDGGVGVRDARDDRLIYTVEPGTNGFIRATLRGLARERKRAGVNEEPPFTLTHWSDGTLSLDDSATGRNIALDAFGPTNAQAFAQLFAARSQRP